MVGPVHTNRPHPTIYDTKEQSLFAMNVTSTQSASGDAATLTPLAGSTTTPTIQSSTPTVSPAPAPAPAPTPTPDPTPPPSSPPPSSPPPSPPPSGGGGSGGGGYGY